MREERDVQNQTVPTIFAQPEETDIHHWRAMIVGPPGTPYCLGLFHFDMRFPQDYPNSAPKVHITTTSGGSVRFNPNLYATGKVCLSILGTWRAENSGEMWSAVQSVSSVLMSIQSLLHDAPYHNEPSFEKDDGSGDPQRYNHKILHETLRVGVCEVMEETLEARTISANGVCPAFAHTRRQLFNMYHERYLSECERLSDEASAKDGAAFKMMPFECSSNGMSGTFGWAKIKARLLKLHESLRAEIETWRRQGAEQTRLLRASHDASVNSCVHYLLQQEERIKREIPEGASIGADPANACVWTATLFGPPDSPWDGGMFTVEMVFPPDFPDAPPAVRFTTPLFHPQINGQGVPYLRCLVMWTYAEPKERTIATVMRQLVGLFAHDPSPEPATHINPAAAALHFSRSEEERKESKRRVKRCVQRSMDM